MYLPILLFALLGIFCADIAHASDELSKKAQGHWRITSAGISPIGVLLIKDPKSNASNRIEFEGYLTESDSQFPVPVGVVLNIATAPASLQVATDGLKLEARLIGDTSFVGWITTRNGVSQVQLEKMSEGAVKDFLWDIPAVSKHARLEMFYLSSYDCPWCDRWESTKKRDLLASAEGKAIRFVQIKNASLRVPIEERDFPSNHKWVYQQAGITRGVPRFLLAIDGKVVLSVFGNDAYDSKFLPFLKRVVEKRETSK